LSRSSQRVSQLQSQRIRPRPARRAFGAEPSGPTTVGIVRRPTRPWTAAMTDSADSLSRNPGRRAADAVRAPTAKVRPTARYVVAAAFERVQPFCVTHITNWSGLTVVDARRPPTRPQRIRVVPGESLGDFVLGMCLNDAMALLCGYRRTPAAAPPTVQERQRRRCRSLPRGRPAMPTGAPSSSFTTPRCDRAGALAVNSV